MPSSDESEVYSCSSDNTLDQNSCSRLDDDDEYFTASDEEEDKNLAMKRSVSEYLVVPSRDRSGNSSRAISLTEDMGRLLSHTNLLSPDNKLKKVKFKLLSDNESGSDTDNENSGTPKKIKSVKKKLKINTQKSKLNLFYHYRFMF